MNDHIVKELEKMELPEAALNIIENLQSLADEQKQRAEAAERKCERLSTSIEMILDSFEQFKKSVSLLETQIDGFVNMYLIRRDNNDGGN